MCIRQTPHDGCAATASSAPGASQRFYVVDDVHADRQRGPHHRRAARVDGDRHAEPERRFDDRRDAVEFLLRRHRRSAGAGRFAADVEDVGTLGDEALAAGDGRGRVEGQVAVGKQSGVTLTIAITRGVARSMRKRVVCQIIAGLRHEKRGRSPV